MKLLISLWRFYVQVLTCNVLNHQIKYTSNYTKLNDFTKYLHCKLVLFEIFRFRKAKKKQRKSEIVMKNNHVLNFNMNFLII